MKFLVLAMCVCAASAASAPSAKPVFKTNVVNAPEVVAKTILTPKVYEPVKSAVYEPVVKPVSVEKDVNAAIVRSESDVAADGFNYVYETDNGISAQSSGVLKKVDDSVKVLVVQGQFKYTAPDGTPVEFSYTADENGYQPQSNVLPVGPAIPEAILRSLEYIRSHPQTVVEKY